MPCVQNRGEVSGFVWGQIPFENFFPGHVFFSTPHPFPGKGVVRLCFARPSGAKKSWKFRKIFFAFAFVLNVLQK